MYHKKIETEIRSPLDYGIGILAGKWKSRIICMLGFTGTMHYSKLKENLISIKDGVLTENLNELIRQEIVEKHNDEYGGNSTEYKLTEKGRLLIPLLEGLCRWGGRYYKEQSDVEMQHCLNCNYYREWRAEAEDNDV